MKTYQQYENLNDAFLEFLKALNRKSEFKIKFYEVDRRNGVHAYSYAGYETKSGGFHGIHYSSQNFAFSFGTRGLNGNSWITGLNFSQVEKISGSLKDSLKRVAMTRKGLLIKRAKRDKPDLNEWI